MSRLTDLDDFSAAWGCKVGGHQIRGLLRKSLERLVRNEEGSSGIEYALMTVLGAIGSIIASAYLQRGFDEVFCRAAQVLTRSDIVIVGWLCE